MVTSVRAMHTNAEIDESAAPTRRDLAEALSFSLDDGRIWMNEHRMVLWRASTVGALRRELIASVGQEQARSLLTRVAYQAGAADAAFVRRLWPDCDPVTGFQAGPRMHMLQGAVRPEPIRFEFDATQGLFDADFLWHDSSEDDEHIAAFGIGTEPACWMLVGYASGYTSAFMGKPIIWREVDCRSMGAPACRVIGKPADEWDDPELDQHYFAPDASAQRMHARHAPPVSPKTALRSMAPVANEGSPLIGISASFSAARHLVERAASTQVTVLFTGPSGVGKEMFAQTLHHISPRAAQPFIALNCAAIPDSLIESELFGVDRGAFTGATTSRPGRFERADGGTLFLDEIASLSYVAQGKLLRALQERRIERVGGTRLISVDVRVVAASNVDLRDEVKAGRFREDLFFRLNVFPIALPPLKDRRDDIPLLMEAFLRRYCELHHREVPGFTHRAVRTLLQYDFPGNIRELQNLVERGVIVAEHGEPIDVHHLFRGGEVVGDVMLGVSAAGTLADSGEAPPDEGPAKPLGRGRASQEAAMYRKALAAARFNVAEAARNLNLSRAQLAYRLKKHGLA